VRDERVSDGTRTRELRRDRPAVLPLLLPAVNSHRFGRKRDSGVLVLTFEHAYSANFAFTESRAVLRPGDDMRITSDVELPDPGTPRTEGFSLARGTYLDRSLANEYFVIADWDAGRTSG
jgi:hypothetical protein